MIAQKTRYALRSLLFLAEEGDGRPVQLSRIAETQRVPPIKAQLRSLDQQVVYTWTIPPPARTLAPGGSASFNSAELNIPAAAQCIDLSFGSAKPVAQLPECKPGLGAAEARRDS